ncbi:helix-turn-helix transcriptional regulator [Actinomadura sp. KC216]|uniref:LuxR C-terminal-related transcriptional regulator n=1 Tax=Actinomadura sp. KC216 TaxID=2530370 RepID=UPI001050ED3F|nr:LuxR family transcriptional regulator [Actinomadura sp. KC216]TDB91947.1 helix-turn-helix transcriptional regulator [Actinomadura sp. KC216]
MDRTVNEPPRPPFSVPSPPARGSQPHNHSSTPFGKQLVGLDQELRTITGMLDAALSGQGAVALVEGFMGVGKTALLCRAHQLARQRGILVLSATAARTEQRFPMGVAHQLMAGMGSTELSLRPPVIRQSPGDRLSLSDYRELADSVASLRRASRRNALLLTVDHLHCTDPETLLWLGFLGRRIDDMAAVLLVSRRNGEPGCPHTWEEFVENVRPDRLLQLNDLKPATALALTDSLGILEPELRTRLVADSGGNPYLLTEQGMALVNRAVPCEDGYLSTVYEHALDSARMINVRERALCLIRRMGEPALRVAYAASAMGGSCADTELIAELSALPVEETYEAYDQLGGAGLLNRDGLSLRHPLLSHLFYRSLPYVDRVRYHRTAAGWLHRRGRASESVSAHLREIGRVDEPWMSTHLIDSAASLIPRSPRKALELIDKASSGDVSEQVCFRTERLRARALLELDLPKSAQVQAELTAVTDGREPGLDDMLRFADTLLRLDRPRQARDILERTAADLHPGDQWPLGRVRSLLAHARLHDSPLDEEPLEVGRLEGVALLRTARGEDAPAVQRIARNFLAPPRAPYGSPAWYRIVLACLWAGGFDLARQHLDAEVQLSRTEGPLPRLAEALSVRSLLQLQRGRLDSAWNDATRASKILAGIGADRYHAGALARSVRIEVMLEHDQLSQLSQLLESDLPLGGPRLTFWQLHLLHSAARALGKLGRPRQALHVLAHCIADLGARNIRNPAIIPWRSTKALLHVGLGEDCQAWRLARDEVEHAERWAAPFALGRALLTMAEVSSGEEALRFACRAAHVLQEDNTSLLLAYALHKAGRARQETGDLPRARELLRRANEVGVSLGAVGLVRLTRSALRAAGGRPDTNQSSVTSLLTTRERQVAELAGRGLSNQRIAEVLFVTRRNVESHLTNVYRKLRIDGRSDLARFFPPDPASTDGPGRPMAGQVWAS